MRRGAGIKKLAVANGLFGLASIESARFFKGVEYEKTFKMVIKNIKLTDRLVKQSGIGYVDDIPCVELTWTCVRLRPNIDFKSPTFVCLKQSEPFRLVAFLL